MESQPVTPTESSTYFGLINVHSKTNITMTPYKINVFGLY